MMLAMGGQGGGDAGMAFGAGAVDVARSGPTSEIVLRGEIDIATTPAFDAAVERVLAAGATELVIDLSAVSFMGSSGLAGLLRTQRIMREATGRLVLREPSRAVRDLLEMTRLLERFGLEADGG